MKKLFFWTVVLLTVICSCSQKEFEIIALEEPEPETELIQLTVKASIGETDGTKTAIQPNGTSIFWTPGDAINLFYGELSAGQFTTSITEPAQSADFNGTLSVATGTTESGMSARHFWGVYPYNVANSCDGDGVILTIPSAQQGVPNTFADKLNPTVATSPGLDLGFYNVGSWFIFSVTQEDVVSATLSGNNNEDIAGTIRVTMDSNSRPVASVQSGAKSITITPQTGDSFVVGELYYMVLIPQTLSGGYTLTLTKADGSTAQCVNSNEAAFVRSQYRRKRNADNGLIYIKEGNIDFADAAVKTICVDNWDTNGDGELSYAEAAAVTSIPYSTFAENTTITSFDEFQYFTGLTSLNYTEELDEGEYDYFGTFYHCTNLTSIVLPPTLKTISVASFRECTSLSEITIPASVTNIQALAFLGCPQLDVIMESETPCTLSLDSHGTYNHPYSFGFLNGMVQTIYVPTEECLDTYKNATWWTSYKWRMKWINEFVPTIPVPEAVDLGLSVKWASFNIGASQASEDGDHYAWGEIETKQLTTYGWDTYLWGSASNSLTKYNKNASLGVVDNKSVLDLEDDVAHVKLGGEWRMPSGDEIDELVNADNCLWEKMTYYGVKGFKVTSKIEGYTDQWIFLPISLTFGSGAPMDNKGGDYWASSLSEYGSPQTIYFRDWNTSFSYSTGTGLRSSGNPVRPVLGKRVSVNRLDLNMNEASIDAGNSESLHVEILPSNATYKRVDWSSSNADVANVTSDGLVRAYGEGTTTITCSSIDGSGVSASCIVSVPAQSSVAIPEAVDLGLSVKWASFNIGATKPEEPGHHYAWGELAIKNNYSRETYRWYLLSSYCKYNDDDQKTVLDAKDDVAHVKLGGDWRMPTADEFDELMNPENCTWEWVSLNGMSGYKVTSKKDGHTDKWIFLCRSGIREQSSSGYNYRGYYWTSTKGKCVMFENSKFEYSAMADRYDGCVIRAVK